MTGSCAFPFPGEGLGDVFQEKHSCGCAQGGPEVQGRSELVTGNQVRGQNAPGVGDLETAVAVRRPPDPPDCPRPDQQQRVSQEMRQGLGKQRAQIQSRASGLQLVALRWKSGKKYVFLFLSASTVSVSHGL